MGLASESLVMRRLNPTEVRLSATYWCWGFIAFVLFSWLTVSSFNSKWSVSLSFSIVFTNFCWDYRIFNKFKVGTEDDKMGSGSYDKHDKKLLKLR